jgi:hypothetical protein
VICSCRNNLEPRPVNIACVHKNGVSLHACCSFRSLSAGDSESIFSRCQCVRSVDDGHAHMLNSYTGTPTHLIQYYTCTDPGISGSCTMLVQTKFVAVYKGFKHEIYTYSTAQN